MILPGTNLPGITLGTWIRPLKAFIQRETRKKYFIHLFADASDTSRATTKPFWEHLT